VISPLPWALVFSLDRLEHPIVQAPLAGGPSTPALAAAVSGAGGLGFLAAGYKTAAAVREDIDELRRAADAPFGVNLFAPPGPAADQRQVERYADSLRAEAERLGAPLGRPRHDDDGWSDKLALLAEERPAVISFTFGCPPADVVEELRRAGAAVWVTVTKPAEALAAREAGADALVVQGVEAGGHRASFDDEAPGDIGLLALLQLVAARVDLPLVATGGLTSGRAVAAVLAAGASAAQLGTAFMLTPEAGTSPAHRRALRAGGDTALTRAFTGRTARGLVNRFLREHSADGPSAYPDVHHLTAPLRAAARERGDADAVNLWAGQAHALAREEPAAEVVRRFAEEARAALREAAERHAASK
jgi:nitronate monooxygenase